MCLSISSLLFSESEKVRRRTVQEASKSTTNEWMTAPFITVKLFSCCEQVVSLETTLRPELIPANQAWTSVPELPLSRWENLIKVTRTICLKFVFDHKIDILESGPLIHKKGAQRQKSSLAIKNGFQTASSRMKKNHFIGNLSYGATGNKSNKLIEFQF